jgi:hypothetical protein
MLTSVHGGTPSTESFTSALAATGTTSSAGAKTFEQQLLSMIASSLERLAAGPENIQAADSRDASQNETAASAKRQILVSYAPTADVPSAASESKETQSENATSTATSVVSAATADTTTEPAVLTSLKTALRSAGHDPDKFKLTYQEQEVWYPDGSYMDRSITATFSDGYQETYGADLTAASPNAAVLSIEHTLRDIAAGTYS